MESTTVFETIVNSFTDIDKLMDYSATMGIQNSPAVRFRLFQLMNPQYDLNFVDEEFNNILHHLGPPEDNMSQFRLQEEIDGAIQAYEFDEEMEASASACVMDGDWSPTSPLTQTGGGEEPQSGPSHRPDPPRGLQYTIQKKSERTYRKNAAVDRTYRVKVDEQYRGQRLQDVRQGLHRMFDEILDHARGDLAGNDLGRIVIHHGSLHDPIVVPLQPWDQLNADKIMEMIEKVLNSNEDLSIDESFEITIGSIDLPKGGARRRITRLQGENNSLDLKTSIVTIENKKDTLCMARAIGVAWAKLKKCSPEEWKEMTKTRGKKSNLELVLEHRKVPENYYKHLTQKKRDEQRQLAVAISLLAGVSQDRPASLNDVEAFEELLGVRVMVVNARMGNKFITGPSTDERPCIYIYLVDDNHFHAISSITGFFSARYFCVKCLKHYDHREKHQCDVSCIVCKTSPCLKMDSGVKCTDCNMDCRSKDCFDRHRKEPVGLNRQRDDDQSKRKSQCETWWKCPTCYKVIKRTQRKTTDHRCGEYLCSSCQTYVLDGHLCYMRATPYGLNKSKFVFFDFECNQDQVLECDAKYANSKTPNCKDCQSGHLCKSCSKCRHCSTSWCGKVTHRPNFVVAQSACDRCKEESVDTPCKNCGYRCEHCHTEEGEEKGEKEPCLSSCGQREFIFNGDDTLNDFGRWLFSSKHNHFKVVAHNMKGYDGYFLLEYLIDQSLRPDKIIYCGSKIMYMTVEKGLNITVMDSLNFLPMKLALLPKAFGLKELKKGWFPHFFNTRENQTYIGPNPEPKYYGVDFMSNKEREDFLSWHQTQQHTLFDFRQEMKEYCRSDVDILRRACLTFRDLLKRATHTMALMDVKKKGKVTRKMCDVAIDPFDYTTIASVCMGIYKTKFLEEEWKVKINEDTDWTLARYIDGNLEVLKNNHWIKEGNLKQDKIITKQFVRSPIAKVPTVKKDQYSKASIQWLECMAKGDGVFIQHALNIGEKSLPGTRYKLDGYCPETNTAYEYNGCVFHGCPECFPDEDTIHPLTKQSMRELYVVTQKKKTYIESLGMIYKGVWEHEFRQQCQENDDIYQFVRTLNITDRLDPRESFFGGRTNASQLYYKVQEKEQIKYVDFTSLYPWVNKYCEYPLGHPVIITREFKDIKEYFGIAKVKIIPPHGLYHPVLPYRSNGKLKFPLCRTCADSENQHHCTCSEEERAITGTWCTPEIQTAVRLGYNIRKIYEVYHWPETTKYDPSTQEGGLFTKYINTFLKFKQEASGPPDWIKTEEDAERYIAQYFETEGVPLDNEHIKKNPGLRALAKLCLNSFWGKFGQRLNMKQTAFFHESEVDKFFQVFTDPMKHPQNFHIIAEDMIQMEWTYEKDCLPEDNKTNIYLATFTTCWARLKLYGVLEKLDRRVLYYDTDSVLYLSRPGEYDPPLGDYLGELTNELEGGEHIIEFVSGGPKNYAYKTNTNKETCKVRGFSLNYTNSLLINFDSVKQIVTESEQKKITVTNPNKICRDKMKRKLYNREENKSYQMVYTKRRRLENYDTEPYGY